MNFSAHSQKNSTMDYSLREELKQRLGKEPRNSPDIQYIIKALEHEERDAQIARTLIDLVGKVKKQPDKIVVADVLYKFIGQQGIYLLRQPRVYKTAAQKLNEFMKDQPPPISQIFAKHHWCLFGTLKAQCMRVIVNSGKEHTDIQEDLQWLYKSEKGPQLPKVSALQGKT